jgi:hypothetical protein
MERPHFRFEDLEIWQKATALAVHFNELASKLEKAKLYRYAEQMRGAGLSTDNTEYTEGDGERL